MKSDDIISEAEIAGFMNWRGPGAYSQHMMRRIKKLIEEVAQRASTGSDMVPAAHASGTYGGYMNYTPVDYKTQYPTGTVFYIKVSK